YASWSCPVNTLPPPALYTLSLHDALPISLLPHSHCLPFISMIVWPSSPAILWLPLYNWLSIIIAPPTPYPKLIYSIFLWWGFTLETSAHNLHQTSFSTWIGKPNVSSRKLKSKSFIFRRSGA